MLKAWVFGSARHGISEEMTNWTEQKRSGR